MQIVTSLAKVMLNDAKISSIRKKIVKQGVRVIITEGFSVKPLKTQVHI